MDGFQRRAEARRPRVTIVKKKLGDPDGKVTLSGAEAVSLVQVLTMTAWAWSRREVPQLRRDELPYRFIPGRRT